MLTDSKHAQNSRIEYELERSQKLPPSWQDQTKNY